MCSQELAHKFFYSPDGNGSYSRLNVSFRQDWNDTNTVRYYSYSTVIAIQTTDKAGRRVCLITNSHYSVTTSKHVRELLNAAPCDVLFVPCTDVRKDFDFASEFELLAKLSPESLNKKDKRESALHLVRMFDQYASRFDVSKDLAKARKSRAVLDVLEMIEFINAKREKRASAARDIETIMKARKRRAAESARKFKRFANNDSLQALQLAFSRGAILEQGMKDAAKEYRESLNALVSSTGRRYSYVWIDGEKCKTSQGVQVQAQDVARMLRVWKAGRDILGAKIDYYTITAKNDEFVQCGCHCIPVWNLNALHAALNK